MAPKFSRDFSVEYGRVDHLSPLIRRVVANNPNRFTFTGTGTYLVGHGDVAVIDPGPADDQHVAAIVAALGPDERISHVVITHTHSDHSPGAALLRALGVDAPTFGYGPHGAVALDDPNDVVTFGDEQADADDRPDAATLREGADTAFTPDVPVSHGDVLVGAGWRLTAVHTPGHTSNHVCYALDGERVLFTGDHVMGWSTSVIGPPDGNLNEYLASLALLLGRPDRTYWPTHGPAITDPKPFVRSFIEHRNERTQQLLDALRSGPASLPQIVPKLYADVDKKLWKPAVASMFAHALALLELGKIRCDGEPRRTSVYELS
jgi:glyoxylase-like metal-dependent hydrolase (beta-lactamase superfamily II)